MQTLGDLQVCTSDPNRQISSAAIPVITMVRTTNTMMPPAMILFVLLLLQLIMGNPFLQSSKVTKELVKIGFILKGYYKI